MLLGSATSMLRMLHPAPPAPSHGSPPSTRDSAGVLAADESPLQSPSLAVSLQLEESSGDLAFRPAQSAFVEFFEGLLTSGVHTLGMVQRLLVSQEIQVKGIHLLPEQGVESIPPRSI
jgi:hypothetical protein